MAWNNKIQFQKNLSKVEVDYRRLQSKPHPFSAEPSWVRLPVRCIASGFITINYQINTMSIVTTFTEVY